MEYSQPYCPKGELAFDGDPMVEYWEDEDYWYSQYHDKYENGIIERQSKHGFMAKVDKILPWVDRMILKILSCIGHK